MKKAKHLESLILGFTTNAQYDSNDGMTYLSQLKQLSTDSQDEETPKILRNCVQHVLALKADLIDNPYYLLLYQVATGLGKSRAALMVTKRKGGRWLIVHHMKNHKKEWIKEIEKWGLDLINFDFSTYRSLKKKAGEYYSGIIHDEIHHHTEASIVHLNNIVAKYNVGLSAFVPRKKIDILRRFFINIKRINIPISVVIKWKILGEIRIFNIPIYLNTRDITMTYIKGFTSSTKTPVDIYYDEFMAAKKSRNFFKHYYRIKCTEAQYLYLLEDELTYWKRRYESGLYEGKPEPWIPIRKLNPIGLQRRNMLSDVKLPALKTLVDFVKKKNLRTVIFGSSIEGIESLGVETMHSKVDNPELQKELFNKKNTDILATVNMLNENVNLNEIQAGIILHTSVSPIQNIQRTGRTVRSKKPILFVLYVVDTKDQTNLERHQEGMEDWITTVDLHKLDSIDDL